jgi:hypothetical protein
MHPLHRILISLVAIAAAFAAAYGMNYFGPKLIPSLAADQETLHLCRYAAALVTLVVVKLALGGYRPIRARC